MKKSWFVVCVAVASLGLTMTASCGAEDGLRGEEREGLEDLQRAEPAQSEQASTLQGAAKGDGADDGEIVVTCDPGETDCGGLCVDLQTSPTDCGVCGHACGGGDCAAGVCQPWAMADAGDALNAPVALAVNGSKLLWSEATSVRSCPLPFGCIAPPSTIASGLQQLRALAATNSKVYFSACKPSACDDYHEFYECPATGCPVGFTRITRSVFHYLRIFIGQTRAYGAELGESLVGCTTANCAGTLQRWNLPGIVEFYASETDGTTVYLHNGSGLHTCPDASGCAFPSALAGSSAVSTVFRAYDGRFFFYRAGFPGQLHSCSISNCNLTDVVQATETGGPVEVELDATGYYWLNTSAGAIRHCPLTGCPLGVPTTLVSGRGAIKELTLGSGAVYWIEGNSIYKVAKPAP